jgi:hypothetical protein
MKRILSILTLSNVLAYPAFSADLPTAAEILENGKLLSFNQATRGIMPFETYVVYKGQIYNCGVIMAPQTRHDIQCSLIEQKPTLGAQR